MADDSSYGGSALKASPTNRTSLPDRPPTIGVKPATGALKRGAGRLAQSVKRCVTWELNR